MALIESGYENAPATRMLAIYCACCRKPLVDAKSVETGMGPVCRGKHGFNKADGVANWPAVVGILLAGRGLDGLVESATSGDLASREVLEDAVRETLPEFNVDALLKQDGREMANRVVHMIAVAGLGVGVAKHIEVLRALGFVKLATIMTKRAASIRITCEGETIRVEAPYSEEFNYALRSVPSRRWDKPSKKNVIAACDKPALFKALCKAFPGQTASGPKGLFVLRSAA